MEKDPHQRDPSTLASVKPFAWSGEQAVDFEVAQVFVGGQPGAGKTMTTSMITHTMELRGDAAHVCGDFYKPYHPDYARLLRPAAGLAAPGPGSG